MTSPGTRSSSCRPMPRPVVPGRPGGQADRAPAPGDAVHPRLAALRRHLAAAGADSSIPDGEENGLGVSDLRWILPAIAGVVILAAIVGFFSWYFTRFIIDDEELRIETGAIFKKSKKIPFERLQSVDIIQPLRRSDLRARRAAAGGRSRRQHHQAALSEPVQGELGSATTC